MTSEILPDAGAALEWYSAAALKTMARSRSERGREARSKAECLALLRACLFDPASIRRALAGLNPIGREAMALLASRGGSMALAALPGQLAVWHPEIPPHVLGDVPSTLVSRALAFWHAPAARYGGASVHDVRRPATDNVNGALIYSPPEILAHVIVPEGLGTRPLVPIGPAETTEAEITWQRRVLAFLRAVETRQPKVLRSGTLGVRDRDAIGAALGLRPAEPEAGEVATPASRFSPTAFLRSTLGAAGLLEVSGDRVLRTTAESVPFVSQPPVRQAKQLLDAWLRAGESELLWLPHLKCERRASAPTGVPDNERARAAHRFLLTLLAESALPGLWYDLAELSRVVRWRDVEFLVSWRDPVPYRWSSYAYYPSRPAAPVYPGLTLEDARGRPRALTLGEDWELVEGAFLRAVVEGPLVWLGLVETQSRPDGGLAFALTSLGARALGILGGPPVAPPAAAAGASGAAGAPAADLANTLVVQPNFDLLVYDPDDHLELLFQVDRFAERVAVDRVALYRLTRDSVCGGLQLGLRADDIIRLLEGASRAPLPGNVAVSLRDWERQLEEVRWLRHAWLLEAPDAATLDRWLELPDLAAALDRRISPTTALLTGERPAHLPTLLNQRGVAVRTVDASDPLAPSAFVDDDARLRIPEIDADMFLIAALEEVAEPLSDEDGREKRFQVTPRSVARARRAGRDPADLLALFQKISRRSLPPGLVVRLKGWSDAYRPVALGPVGYFVAPDPESFRELRADPELADAFVETVSPTSALVRLDALARLRDALAARGIATYPYEPPLPRGGPHPPTPSPSPLGEGEDVPRGAALPLSRADTWRGGRG